MRNDRRTYKDIKRDYKHICFNVKPAFSDFRRKAFKYIRKLINFKEESKSGFNNGRNAFPRLNKVLSFSLSLCLLI